MDEIPGWNDDVHSSIKGLIDFVCDRLSLLTTADAGSPTRHLAAAYLARVRRLVMAIDVLYEAGMPDVIGSVMRVCLEAWITGMWVLVEGQPAVTILQENHVFRSNQLIEAAELGLDLLDPVDPESPHLPHIETRAKAVERRLVEEGDSGPKELLWSFRLVYGGESGAGIHAGWAAVAGHLDEQPGGRAFEGSATR